MELVYALYMVFTQNSLPYAVERIGTFELFEDCVQAATLHSRLPLGIIERGELEMWDEDEHILAEDHMCVAVWE